MEQHEKLVRLNDRSWHYRLIKYVWDINPKEFKNLCPYFWLTVAGLAYLPILLLIRGAKKFFIKLFDGFSYLINKTFEKDFEKWLSGLSENEILYYDIFETVHGKQIPKSFSKVYGSESIVSRWAKLKGISTFDLRNKYNDDSFIAYKKLMREKEEEKERKETEKEINKENKRKIAAKRTENVMKKYSSVIEITKQIIGILISCILGVMFLSITAAFIYVFTGMASIIINNVVEVTITILVILAALALILLGSFYGSIIENKFERFINKEKTSFAEKLYMAPAILLYYLFLALKFIFVTFLWKWIILSTFNAFKIFFFEFTGIFGEYFSASYSDYCPGIEWEEDDED